MDITILVGIGGGVLGLLQGIGLLILKDIRRDQAEIWRRVNSHYHVVACDNEDCKKLHTGNVILPSGQGR